MSKKLRSIERIHTVQKQKLRLAEWKVFDLQRRQAVLMQTHGALQQLLEAHETFGSPLAVVAARTDRRAGSRVAALEQAEAVAHRQMQHEYRQFKLSEKLWRDHKQQDNQQKEKYLLDSIIEQIGFYKF